MQGAAVDPKMRGDHIDPALPTRQQLLDHPFGTGAMAFTAGSGNQRQIALNRTRCPRVSSYDFA